MSSQSYVAKSCNQLARLCMAAQRLFLRRLWIVVALALALGSAGQLLPVLAAPVGAPTFSMRADRSRSTWNLCVGDVVNIYATVRRTDVSIFGTASSQGVSGSRVDVTVGDPSNVVSIAPQSNTTGWDIDNAGAAKFVLTAKKVGETPVAFTARIDHQWFGTQFVDQRDFAEDGFGVRVIPCKFNVSIVSKFSAQSVRFVAYLQGNLTSDADGHFTGSVPVTWIRAYSIGARDCTGLIEITDSEAKMTGHLNDDGALEVEVTYLPASLTHKGTCGVSKTTQAMVTPATLSLVVPASGEASTQSQQLNEPTYYTMPGSASIVVMPEQTGSE